MKKIAIILTILVLIYGCANVFYKEVTVGPNCTFKISRFWSVDKVDQFILDSVRKITIDYDKVRYKGKEILFDAWYMKINRKFSIDGGIQNSIHQMRNQPGVNNFVYTCSTYSIPNGNAKRCQISYKKNKLDLYYQLLFYVPDNDPYTAYFFTGAYVNLYDMEVFEKIYSSLVFK